MKDLRGKRLLLLGGSMWKDAIKQFADENEVVLIAAGNDTTAGIFEISQESYRVNSTDIEGMKRLIKEKKIDGVYMGGSEPVIAAASLYLNELGMPCYCNNIQWNCLQDKSQFKDLCLKFGLPCVRRYNIYDKDIKYPVITKPTDGCGSNGFSVNYNREELEKGYAHAKEASPTGSVLIEQFVKNDSVVAFYTFSGGRVYFSGLEDKYPVRYSSTGSYVAGMHLFESKYVSEFRGRFDTKIEELFRSIGIREGSAWIEIFHDGDEYYFNEVGFRYSGSVSVYPVNYLYGINQVSTDIYYALTGESLLFNDRNLIYTKIPNKKYYCIYNVHMLSGTVKNIEGLEILRNKPEFVFIADTKKVGSIVIESGTVSQVFAFVHFVFDNEEELRQIITSIYDTLHVKNVNGCEMIIDMLQLNSKKIIL